MDSHQKVLFLDAATGYYKTKRYKVGDYFGPIDLGLHLSSRYKTFNIGTGLLAGSIFPGSNRLVFTGSSPNWQGFYISSMGGAGLVFENLGLNMLSITGKAGTPSVLYLNRVHGEEIEVTMEPVNVDKVWYEGREGIYSLTDYVYEKYGHLYENDPRILVTGPAATTTDTAGICSVPIEKGKITFVDTWAGRGGFGSKMLQEHGIVAIIYGGTVIDEDFRDRKVADQWFIDKYEQKLLAKDMEATKKYRFDPKFETGGTFGVNYTTLKGRIMAFNYKSMFMTEEERVEINDRLITKHYLKQFNEETIQGKQNKTCGEPCVAVCKKMNGIYKKDYEPYQTMGPLSGVFDQRAAEKLNHHADMLAFDAISIGGMVAWLMEALDEGHFTPEELGVSTKPKFNPTGFDVVNDSMHNANLGIELLDSIYKQRGILDISEGARKFARKVVKLKGKKAIDGFVYVANGRKGWMVPNQYWTPGALSPMAIMGKYYMYYGADFVPPRTLGKMNAERLKKELILDNIGLCRFHRGWGEEMIPEIVESLYGEGMGNEFLQKINATAARINSRNASVFWETERTVDYLYTFLQRTKNVEKDDREELQYWLDFFEKDRKEAALQFWYEIHKGIHESLTEFE